jgi:hypothetical protein
VDPDEDAAPVGEAAADVVERALQLAPDGRGDLVVGQNLVDELRRGGAVDLVDESTVVTSWGS